MENKDRLQQMYLLMSEDVTESIRLAGEDLPREQWVFMSGLLMLLSALQMEDKAKAGALFILQQFLSVHNMDWENFKTAAMLTITRSEDVTEK